MPHININDRVEIVQANPKEQHLLNKVGRVILIADDTKAVVALEDGSGATVHINQLKKR